MCVSDTECSDGLFCSGVERCAPSATGADSRGCVPAPSTPPPCPVDQTCDEVSDVCAPCAPSTRDVDEDGHRAVACGGDDCDDTDSNDYPGNVERCDTLGHDEDCNPATYGRADIDHDGYDDQICCNGLNCGDDCDDTDTSIHPDATEACNGYDDNCNGMSDEGVLVAYYADEDNDSYGDVLAGMGCTVPSGNATRAGDCADSDRDRHPGVSEACNGLDDDCNGMADEDLAAFCTAMLGAHGPAACVATTTGAECRPTDCAMGFADCNGNASDGCESDTCNSALQCNHCGGTCDCIRGQCVGLARITTILGTVSNVGGARLAGATVRPLFGCNAESATTDAMGRFMLEMGVQPSTLYRVDLGTRRTHVVLDGDFDIYRPATLTAWLADPDAPSDDPATGIVVLEVGTGIGLGAWTIDSPSGGGRLVVGTDVAAPGVTPPGAVTTEVYFRVAPGPVRLAPVVPVGCSVSCSPVRTWVLPGGVTRVSIPSCAMACA